MTTAMELASLSVVIPTHGGRESVKDAVAALLATDYPQMEVIVVSDGSAVDAQRILEPLSEPRLRILEMPKRGSASTRNAGLAASSADWVAFVDDDDLPTPDWMSTWLEGVQNNASVIVGAVRRSSPDNPTVIKACHLDPFDPTMGASTLLAGAFWVKRELLNAVEGYDVTLKAAQNQDLGLRLCASLTSRGETHNVYHSKTAVIEIHVQQSNLRDVRYGSTRAESARVFLERYEDRLAKDPRHKAALLRIIARSDRLRGARLSSIQNSSRALLADPRTMANHRSLFISMFPRLASWVSRHAFRRSL